MQHLRSTSKNFSSHKIVTTLTKSILSGIVGMVALGSVSGPGAQAATAVKPGNAAVAFCRQVTASQGSIAKATGTPAVKLSSIGAEWTKIAATAPADIKADVLVVRTAYVEAAKAGVDTPAKAPAVATAGAKISSYFAQNCGGGGIAGAAGQGGDGEDGPGRGGPGGNSLERVAYRECLTKNGVTLPAPGQRPNGGPANGGPSTGAAGNGTGGKAGAGVATTAAGAKAASAAKPAAGAAGNQDGPGNGGPRGGFGLDPNDPAVAKAMKACESLRPAGGFGGGRGGFGNPAMQACLAKKGVTLAPPGDRAGGNAAGGNTVGGNTAGANGAAAKPVAKPAAGNAAAKPAAGVGGTSGGPAGGRPTLDAKTQAAFDACQKEVGANG
jgi:hypothetical protein